MSEPYRIILTNHQSCGDVIAITALPRDIHRQYPGEFEIGVSTSWEELWQGNPHIKVFPPMGPTAEVAGWRKISLHNPRVNESNRLPRTYLEAWHDYLGKVLGRRLEATEAKGDLYVSEEEKNTYPVTDPGGEPVRYWLIIGGGKFDFSAHWPVKAHLQELIWKMRDAFGEKIRAVQIGGPGHFHPDLDGAINLVGRTSLRQVIQLIFHSEGCVGPNTFLNHACAAVPIKRPPFVPPDPPHPAGTENMRVFAPLRPNIVLGGGHMPVIWSSYPGTQFLHTIGQLDCCASGGCWRSRAQVIGDGADKDTTHLCLHPLEFGNISYASCMDEDDG